MVKPMLLYVFILLLGGGACQQKAVAPAGCDYSIQKPLVNESDTYQFDAANRLNQVVLHSASSDAEYSYAYRDRQVTIKVSYPKSDWLRIQYDVLLNEQGYALSAQETVYQRLFDGTFEGKPGSSHTFGYDADGHLTAHQVDEFIYPIGAAKRTETYQQTIQYAAGNPVFITYTAMEAGVIRENGTISNRYGSQVNPVRIPLLLETDRETYFFLDSPLQPLLGKSPANLITFSKVTRSQGIDSTRFVYQSDGGQLLEVIRQPGAPNVFYNKPFTYSFKNNCP